MITKQEIEYANSMDIVSFLKARGMSAKRVGSTYEWQSPGGKVSIKGSKWYSQYERVGGHTIDFVKKYFGLDFKGAMEELLGKRYTVMKESGQEKPKKPFKVPKAAENNNRVYKYLCDTRYIDKEVVDEFVKMGLIFEDKEYHNAVFVGKDGNGKIRHIHKRATNSSDFKGNAESSNASCSFNWKGNSERLFVFEAPIDMLSYITLYKRNWKENFYVALCSTASDSAIRMLKDNPNIKEIYLCLDYDGPGIEGAYRIADRIREVCDCDIWRVFPDNKDWNEDLKSMHGEEVISSSEHPKEAYVKALCDGIEERVSEYDLDIEKEDITREMQIILFKIGENPDKNSSEIQAFLEQLSDLSVLAYRNETGKRIDVISEKIMDLYKPHLDYKNAEGIYENMLRDFKKAGDDPEAFICLAKDCFAMSGSIQRTLDEQENKITIGGI